MGKSKKTYANDCLKRAQKASEVFVGKMPTTECEYFGESLIVLNDTYEGWRDDVSFLWRSGTDIPELSRRLNKAIEWCRGEEQKAILGGDFMVAKVWHQRIEELEAFPVATESEEEK